MRQSSRKRKIAYLATVYNHIRRFHVPIIQMLQAKGYEVHVYAGPDFARNEVAALPDVVCHDVYLNRNPFHMDNCKALLQIIKSFRTEQFDLVHVHTPIGSVIGRIAAKIAKVKAVLYTAHGFHFFRGGPLRNWVLYYPIERIFSKLCDGLITINKEDYQIAQRFMNNKAFLIHGMGVDLTRFQPPKDQGEKTHIRQKLGLSDNCKILITVAEINTNKNHIQVIEALHMLKPKFPDMVYLIVGSGNYSEVLTNKISQWGLNDYVLFLGQREDIDELLKAADLFILSSKREGLSLAAVEAMASGLPIIMSNTCGGRTLVENGVNGYLIEVGDVVQTAEVLEYVMENPSLVHTMGVHNTSKAGLYALDHVLKQINKIYDQYLK